MPLELPTELSGLVDGTGLVDAESISIVNSTTIYLNNDRMQAQF